ncbi:subtilisin-like protein [Piromyces finnis]|uniref:Subtilisin-like protein n=1 Tax=Piromyces finnis TaxID=1754191 RepID=A0A1Y1UV54_9FUNG|nr:subtilisin-like protein [Piromyces finnis]|eukprot:ORX41356.1 subtilisin-like protein [Piromyces finnis]
MKYLLKILSLICLFLFTVEVKGDDKFYIIQTVFEEENTDFTREEFILDKINSITGVIKNSINTYNNITFVENEIKKLLSNDYTEDTNPKNTIEKREDYKKYSYKPNNLINYISSLKTSTDVLYGYLNEVVAEEVSNMEGIIKCIEDIELGEDIIESDFTISYLPNENKNANADKVIDTENFENYYDITKIKEETNWKDVRVQKEAYSHLSLISQYKYDSNNIHLYDNNYYITDTAGEGVDIFIIDRGINTIHLDFTEDDEKNENEQIKRTVTCDAIIQNGTIEILNPSDKRTKICSLEKNGKMPVHGTRVASVAAGCHFGVAKKANIHAIATDMSIGSLLLALTYLRDNAKSINPNKTVVNMSFGAYDIEDYSVLNDLINELSKLGFMFVASAGNNKVDGCTIQHGDFPKIGYHIPSFYENVISVGAIGDEELYQEDYFNGQSSDIYSIASFSNYGYCTDIFAPGYVYAAYHPEQYIKDFNENKVSKGFMYAMGTSYSAPIVAGIAALLISENRDTVYNQKILRNELVELSQKNVIVDNYVFNNIRLENTPNRLVNNGKKSVYSRDNIYNDNSCGIYAGNRKCPKIPNSSKLNCCSIDGICGSSTKYCLQRNGCQSEFGECAITSIQYKSTTTKLTTNASTSLTSTRTTTVIKTIFTPITESTPTITPTSTPAPTSTSSNTSINSSTSVASISTGTVEKSYITTDHKLGWLYITDNSNEKERYLCLSLNSNNVYSKPILKECSYSDYNKWYVPMTKPGYYINSFDTSLCLELNSLDKYSGVNSCYDVSSILPVLSTGKIQTSDDYCFSILIKGINYLGGMDCKSITSDYQWKFSGTYSNIGKENLLEDEDFVDVDITNGNFRSSNAVKSWIYNQKLKLCLSWNGSILSRPLLKKCTYNDLNLWYVANDKLKKGYYVNSYDNSFCISVTTTNNVIIKRCDENVVMFKNKNGTIQKMDSDNSLCLGIFNFNESIDYINEKNIKIVMEECSNEDDQNWVVTTTLPGQ